MPYFSFQIQQINIKNTRSKHEDTDYLAFTLKLGVLDPQTVFQSLGNHNSGLIETGLGFQGIELGLADQFTFNYMIVNAGSTTPAKAEAALQAAGAAWANGQGPASTNLVGALEDSQPWFNNELRSILNLNGCDGMVAAEQDHFSYGDLVSMLVKGPFTHTTNHPGVRSASGCGPNSQYTVTWNIDQGGQVV